MWIIIISALNCVAGLEPAKKLAGVGSIKHAQAGWHFFTGPSSSWLGFSQAPILTGVGTID
jgi:hypothetical protein